MNKFELIKKLATKADISRDNAKTIVELFFNEMTLALTKGDRVEIRGFAALFIKQYKGYIGKNPKTGEKTEIEPKKLPFFRCGKELKDRVNKRKK